MTTTNKWYSYLRVTTIRIDIHPAGKIRPTHHTHPMLSPCMVLDHTNLTWSTYSNLSRAINIFGQISRLPRKRAPDIIPSTPAGRPICGSVPSFSPEPTNEAVGLSQTSVDDEGLLDSYHQHAINTVNTCSRGPTHRSLINTGGCYNLEGAGFSHITPRPSQPTVSPFHLRAPPGL
jgi:hypothetical protein